LPPIYRVFSLKNNLTSGPIIGGQVIQWGHRVDRLILCVWQDLNLNKIAISEDIEYLYSPDTNILNRLKPRVLKDESEPGVSFSLFLIQGIKIKIKQLGALYT